ncbi:MAG: ACP S-malonyltransferase [Candidatus Neomarinimicrobiota bacterium]
MIKEKIVVICPGRGSYTRDTSNYLGQYGKDYLKELRWMDVQRESNGRESLTKLDSQIFRSQIHMVGENASSLIYACSLSDFLHIDTNKYEVVSVLGNSMGWYTSLVLSGAITKENGFHLIESMGSMMKNEIIGGQLIYPIINENWKIDQKTYDMVLSEVHRLELYISIKLGGYLVIGGEKNNLVSLSKNLPTKEKYPFIIPHHAAFHTPLLKSISKTAKDSIASSIFNRPSIPLVDGTGKIWSPYSTETSSLMEYTLGHQVLNTFDFTSSVTVALKEFCPDKLFLLGPGNSLGGAVGQILIENNWIGLKSKKDFSNLQKESPFLISLGLPEQRNLL